MSPCGDEGGPIFSEIWAKCFSNDPLSFMLPVGFLVTDRLQIFKLTVISLSDMVGKIRR